MWKSVTSLGLITKDIKEFISLFEDTNINYTQNDSKTDGNSN